MKLEAIVEIPKASFYKFEQNKETGELVLDRVMSLPCPYNYGYITGLPLSGDGDPLDVFIISADAIPPLTKVKIKVWGMLLCEDQGVEDNKVIAVIENDLFRDYDYIHNIRFYLENYKTGFKIKEYKIFNDHTLFKNFVESNKKT